MTALRSWLKRYGATLLSVLLLLLLWEWAAGRGSIQATFFPPPSAIWAKFLQLVTDGTLLEHTLITVLRLLAAFAVASVTGIIAGLLLGLSSTIRRGFSPIMAFIYPVPSVLWLPTVATFLGRGTAALILTSSITAFFLVALSTMTGVMRIEPVLLEAGRNYGARGPKLFTKVLLPGALPFIFTGLRLALGFSIIVVLAVEMLVSQAGLGGYLWEAWELLRIEHMYATLMVVVVLGLLSAYGVDWLGTRLMPWRHQVEGRGTKGGPGL